MALREAWARAADDRFPPKEQAKFWGLREALRKLDQEDTQYAWMARTPNNANTAVRFYYFMG